MNPTDQKLLQELNVIKKIQNRQDQIDKILLFLEKIIKTR
jgi:hypothetical protein